jgi:hypothetical protein
VGAGGAARKRARGAAEQVSAADLDRITNTVLGLDVASLAGSGRMPLVQAQLPANVRAVQLRK